MSQFPSVPVSSVIPKTLSADECKAVLERNCFGHLAFARQTHIDVVPVRFAFVEGWLYFRADAAMRSDIARNAWVVVSVAEMLDATHVASVVARGACHPTERTDAATGDAAATSGIVQLRDRVPVAATRRRRLERTSTVFRVHADELRGRTTFVPRPASGSDSLETQHVHRPGSHEESAAEDARADDDGMREPRDASLLAHAPRTAAVSSST